MTTKRRSPEGYHMPEKRRARRQRERIKVASQSECNYHPGAYVSLNQDGCYQKRALKGIGG